MPPGIVDHIVRSLESCSGANPSCMAGQNGDWLVKLSGCRCFCLGQMISMARDKNIETIQRNRLRMIVKVGICPGQARLYSKRLVPIRIQSQYICVSWHPSNCLHSAFPSW